MAGLRCRAAERCGVELWLKRIGAQRRHVPSWQRTSVRSIFSGLNNERTHVRCYSINQNQHRLRRFAQKRNLRHSAKSADKTSHSECVAADVSRLKLLPRRNNERTHVRCYSINQNQRRLRRFTPKRNLRHSVKSAEKTSHSECVAADVSRLKLLPRRNNGRTHVRCYSTNQNQHHLRRFTQKRNLRHSVLCRK